jgi:hypothetical protein
MPLCVVNIQQTARDRWVAEYEGGGVVARRKLVNATSFDDIMLKVIEAHALLAPPELPAPAQGPDRPIDESLLPPKPAAPLSKTAAQQMRVARSLAPWTPAGQIETRLGDAMILGKVPAGTLGDLVLDALVPSAPEPRARAIGLSARQKAHAKRMERAAARHDRLMASDTPGE